MRDKENVRDTEMRRDRIREAYRVRISKAGAEKQTDTAIREMTPEQFVRYLQTVPEDQIMQVSVSDGEEDAGEA